MTHNFKINKIRWLPRKNAAHFLLSTNDKTIKLWKVNLYYKAMFYFNVLFLRFLNVTEWFTDLI